MSDAPRDYHFNNPAADELDRQAFRGKSILEELASHLAFADDGDIPGLVEPHHVRRAADLLFGRPIEFPSPNAPRVFVSYSHSDDAFVVELTEKIAASGITCFKADRDIEPASVWTEAIWTAIRDCEVFLLVVTHKYLKSRWFDLEGGAAMASRKKVVLMLRHVERGEIPIPFDRFQSVDVQSSRQLDQLVDWLTSELQ
jgi:hypothetical protein